MKNEQEKLAEKYPPVFTDGVRGGWRNSVRNWYIHDATPGLYTLDIEHVPSDLAARHNDVGDSDNIAKRYRIDLCPHKCSFCFNEQSEVYGEIKNVDGTKRRNNIMSLERTFEVVDQAIEIARDEGHDFRNVKFLGPGELLLNPELFDILDGYKERNVGLGIFTKGSVLGDDSLAQKYQGMSARGLTDKLAEYENVSLILSFQSFDHELQDAMVTTRVGGETKGLLGYSDIRDKAIDNLFGSRFYKHGVTDRVGIINAPITPENIGESFDIYEFWTRRGTPVITTTSMISGKGCEQVGKQNSGENACDWEGQLVDFYARVYDYNVRMGIQTEEEIEANGVSSYAGADPCNQVSTGLYVRANGYVQMCPGRFDEETFFGDLEEKTLKEIWDGSVNKQRGFDDPQNLINNRCPAKDGCALPDGFYDKVMTRYLEMRAGGGE